MRIFVPRETDPHETRAALAPENVKTLLSFGAQVCVETGVGVRAGHSDEDYQNAGAEIIQERGVALKDADIFLRVQKPPADEVAAMRKGAVHVSYLDPFNEGELVKSMALAGLSAYSMEMIPRTTVAQKMDALSSQANLAGYAAVVLAAERIDRVLPMMMTPAGTIAPARVFIIGVGVAGLQAIATAKRLGARVEAFDTRPVVEEQVASLGAKFVKVDLGETGQTAQGYAKELTPEQLEKQRVAMARHCATADIVITTAQLFGRKAPRIVNDAMIAGMRPGSVIVDLAAETGGNVEGSIPGEEVVRHGVRIIGARNLPGRVARHATQMYGSNLASFLTHFWNKDAKAFQPDFESEIIQGALVTHNGEIVNPVIRKHMGISGSASGTLL